MNAQVVLGKTRYTIRGADHLRVDGELVEIQRAMPTGYETIAVAGEDMLVTIGPAECAANDLEAAGDGPLWHPVGEPLD
jgi:hypothetical protein